MCPGSTEPGQDPDKGRFERRPESGKLREPPALDQLVAIELPIAGHLLRMTHIVPEGRDVIGEEMDDRAAIVAAN